MISSCADSSTRFHDPRINQGLLTIVSGLIPCRIFTRCARQSTAMSLETIFHAVPAFLDACDAEALSILSLTNSTFPQKVHAQVRSVSQRSLQSKDMAALVSALFTHLTNLHISATLSVSQVSILTTGDWPMLRKVTLYIPLDTLASIQKIKAAPWPQLEELDLGLTSLHASDLKLLVEKDWPLKVLRCKLSNYMSANNVRNAMSALQQSSWTSSLQSIQLDFSSCPDGAEVAGLSELKRGEWQQLTKLALEIGRWTRRRLHISSRAIGPNCKALASVCMVLMPSRC